MIEKKILEVIEKIRPFLNNDGGDIEFIKYEDGIVYVTLTGACANCGLADVTLATMVEDSITFEIPEVVKVINIKGYL
jgi:Fe-S cluster biogenesis protein NfuA